MPRCRGFMMAGPEACTGRMRCRQSGMSSTAICASGTHRLLGVSAWRHASTLGCDPMTRLDPDQSPDLTRIKAMQGEDCEGLPKRNQIGRATCRERVSQYV